MFTHAPSSRSARRLATAALVLGGVPAVLASSASAADLHVSTAAQLTSALKAAADTPSADRVLLDPGTYTGPFEYDGTSGIEIIGAGPTTTIAQPGHSAGLTLGEDATSQHVSNLNLAVNATGPALSIRGPATVDHVSSTAAPGAVTNVIESYAPSTIRDSALVGAPGRAAIIGVISPLDVEDTSVSGAGILLEGAGATGTITRVRITEPSGVGIGAQTGGVVHVSDSVVDLGSKSGVALRADDSNNGPNNSAMLDATRTTIVGDGKSDQTGASVHDAGPGDHFKLVLSDSVVDGVSTPLQCNSSGNGVGALSTSYSRIQAGSSTSCSTPTTQAHPITVADPGFVDRASGDLHLRFDSPLVDAGDPSHSAAAKDLGGMPRPVRGHLKGSAATVDVGAYEYQRSAPVVSAKAQSSSSVLGGPPVPFSASTTDADPGETASITWTFDDGATATGPSVSHAFTTLGTHTATATATDSAGVVGSGTASVVIVSPGSEGTAGVAQTAPGAAPKPVTAAGLPKTLPAADRTAPRLTGVSLRRGVLRLRLSEAAALRLTVQRRSGHAYTAVKGSLRLAAAPGATKLTLKAKPFAGLRPGRYRLTIVARDAAGNAAAPVRASFTVARRSASKGA